MHAVGTRRRHEIQPVVDQQTAGDGPESRGESKAGVSPKLGGAYVKSHGATATQSLGARIEIRKGKNAVIRDRVEARDDGAQENTSPLTAPRPRSHWWAAIRVRPAGCTSRNCSAPSPVATTSAGSVAMTSPGFASGPVVSAGRGP